ncbi:hypothetical protein LJC35_02645 [Parabacteroides sp. OttesenSCG-928-N08]|nr:hypothetical protein [Parabacteroides sp. OttesenSCG-928-N08]
MSKLRMLIVGFKNEIRQDDISKFRGAIIATMQNAHILFHNHNEEGFRYAYPLIQYKRIHRKASVVCIGEGAEVIGDFFSHFTHEIKLGEIAVDLEIESVKASQVEVQLWDSLFTYRITRWLPLNQENYKKYVEMESLVDQYKMLERLLIGNMLSFAKSIGVIFQEQVTCSIVSVDHSYVMNYKGVKMLAFDISFKSNLSLPDYLGLGKGVSLGFGVVSRKKNRNDNKKRSDE